MSARGIRFGLASLLCACAAALVLFTRVHATSETLPSKLSDQEYWKLVTELSEPDGWFRSDNLLSNEIWMQYVIPELTRTVKPGRVYMGVGPEQNFTYIAAVKPRMVFIVDIRRGNMDLQLMYKALFESSSDRVEFVSRLFSRKRPEGLAGAATAQDIFTAFMKVEPTEAAFKDNLKAIDDRLTKKHGFALSDVDLGNVENIYKAFYTYGPGLQYSSTGGFGGRAQPTYADLMTATDGTGQNRSYLASEETFTTIKKLEADNLIVPVVGDFAGPKAIRAVGKYLKERGGIVSAFYLSNVEQYLAQQDKYPAFCANVAALPLDETSRFIRATRSNNGGYYGRGFGLTTELGEMATEVKACAQ